jgi:poly-D-alanine transfer protein DltD
MNFSDTLTSYTAEIVDIMQEVQAKMQRVQEIKTEIDKLKQVETKITKPTKATTNNNKITCECGCTINKSSWYSHIKTKKHLKKLEEVNKVEEVKPEVAKIVDTNDETDDDSGESCCAGPNHASIHKSQDVFLLSPNQLRI